MPLQRTGVAAGILLGSLLFGSAASAQDKTAVDHGIKVYAAQKCSVCHSIEGKGKKSGPLDGVGSKLLRGGDPAVDRERDGDDEEDQVDQEAGHEELRETAQGGRRRARGLHDDA